MDEEYQDENETMTKAGRCIYAAYKYPCACTGNTSCPAEESKQLLENIGAGNIDFDELKETEVCSGKWFVFKKYLDSRETQINPLFTYWVKTLLNHLIDSDEQRRQVSTLIELSVCGCHVRRNACKDNVPRGISSIRKELVPRNGQPLAQQIFVHIPELKQLAPQPAPKRPRPDTLRYIPNKQLRKSIGAQDEAATESIKQLKDALAEEKAKRKAAESNAANLHKDNERLARELAEVQEDAAILTLEIAELRARYE